MLSIRKLCFIIIAIIHIRNITTIFIYMLCTHKNDHITIKFGNNWTRKLQRDLKSLMAP